MNINTNDLRFVNFNGEEMNWVKFNGVTIYEGWKELTKSGMPPLSLKSNGSDLIKYTMYGNSLQNGVPTPSNPIEIVSVGEYDSATGKYKIPVKVRGKNLHNSSTDVFGSYINANGVLVADNSSSYTQLIPVKSNTVYGFSCQTKTGISAVQNKRLHAYDKDGNWIQQLCYLNYPIGEKGYKYAICTTPSNCSFVRISHIARFEDFIQLEEEQVTEYEPYIEPIKTDIYLDEPLRKIGEYVDYIDYENKKVVRNIEKRDCSELEWYQHASYKYVYVFNSARTKAGTNPMSEVFNSTKYQPADSIKNMTTDFCIKSHATSSATYVSDSVHTTEEEFIEFIKDKTIYYPLKTSEEETIELPSIAMAKGSVVLETDTRLQPSNLEITYKGK